MIGEKIRLLRKQANLSQEEFGDIFHVSKQLVSGWENDEATPTLYTLREMAYHFRVTSDYILELEERTVISVDSLTENQIAHILQLVDDLAKLNKGTSMPK